MNPFWAGIIYVFLHRSSTFQYRSSILPRRLNSSLGITAQLVSVGHDQSGEIPVDSQEVFHRFSEVFSIAPEKVRGVQIWFSDFEIPVPCILDINAF